MVGRPQRQGLRRLSAELPVMNSVSLWMFVGRRSMKECKIVFDAACSLRNEALWRLVYNFCQGRARVSPEVLEFRRATARADGLETSSLGSTGDGKIRTTGGRLSMHETTDYSLAAPALSRRPLYSLLRESQTGATQQWAGRCSCMAAHDLRGYDASWLVLSVDAPCCWARGSWYLPDSTQ